MSTAVATPRAAEVAEELGIEIDGVEGTGRDGKVTVEDVRSFADDLLDEPNLTQSGKRIYADVKAYLEEFELWHPVYRPLLERYVRNLTRSNWARRRAEAKPSVKGSTGQPTANPMFAIARNAELDAHKYSIELLITPKAMKEHLREAGEKSDDTDLGF